MLEWLTRRKTPQEPQQSSDAPVPQSPSPEMEKLRARIQQNLDESDRIRKAQSILQRNPSSEELLTHLHRTDADIRLLLLGVSDSRRAKRLLKLRKLLGEIPRSAPGNE